MITKEATNPAEEFWNYSCALYEKPGVEPACIALQDRLGADVNILLFVCWLADGGFEPLNQDFIEAATGLSQPWQTGVINPIRKLRKQLKNMTGDDANRIGKSLLRSELEAERAEQGALMILLDILSQPQFPPTKQAAHQSALTAMESYMGMLGAKTLPDEISIIVMAAFSTQD